MQLTYRGTQFYVPTVTVRTADSEALGRFRGSFHTAKKVSVVAPTSRKNARFFGRLAH